MSLFKRIQKIRCTAILGFLSLLVGFSISGCSSIQIGYNQSDMLIRWWIDDHLDLIDSQEDFVSAALKQQITWHRANVLPKINEDLGKLKLKLNKPLSAADVMDSYQDIRKHSYTTIEHFGKDFSRLALSLNADQLRVMEKKFVTTNEKFRKDFMSGTAQKQLQKRIDRTIDRTENFFGNLSNDQESQIAKIVQSHPVDMEAIYRERLRRQRDMLALLKKISTDKPRPENVEALFANYVKTFELGTTPEQKEVETKRAETLSQMISAITQLMNEQQRKHAQHKVGDWMDDVKTLIANR
jgi:hypothetical protein